MAIYRFTADETAARKEALSRFSVRYLLGFDLDPKTQKSNAKSDQYSTAIQYLAPHTIGGVNLCTSASEGCIRSCLFFAGNPAYKATKETARVNRKRLFVEDRALYLRVLCAELNYQIAHANHIGRKLAVRLNGTSDVPWERLHPDLFAQYPEVQFYDYTKHVKRMAAVKPFNYHLTFSRSERNHSDCLEVLRAGYNVAAVFSTPRTKPLPWEHDGFDVIDQDTDDLIFQKTRGLLTGRGYWLGLRAKGPARRDTSGFVIQVR